MVYYGPSKKKGKENMSDAKDNRMKLDTMNSETVRRLSDSTGDNPQDIIREALNAKATVLSINGLDRTDQQKLETFQKYQEAEINLLIDIFREKTVDADKLRTTNNNERLLDKTTIKELNSSLEKKEATIRELTKKLNSYDERIHELEATNAQLDKALSMLTTLTTGARQGEIEARKNASDIK